MLKDFSDCYDLLVGMTSHSSWLNSRASLPAREHVLSAPEEEVTHLQLSKLRGVVAWWMCMQVTPGRSLFLVRKQTPVVPPLPMPGSSYNPRKDPELQDFLSLAYEGAQFWMGSGTDPKVRACIRALLDPLTCQAAWPTTAQIFEIERKFMRTIEFDLEKGASPLRLVRTIMENFPFTSVQSKELISEMLHQLLDNKKNQWSPERLEPLLDVAYSGDIRDGINTHDRRLASQARTNKARFQGLISNKPDSSDQKELLESLIDGIAKAGKNNPVPLPPATVIDVTPQ